MRHSSDRVVTSHAGSLPRPDALIAANQARQVGADEGQFQDQLRAAVQDVQFSRLPSPPAGMEVAGIDLVIRLRRAGTGD